MVGEFPGRKRVAARLHTIEPAAPVCDWRDDQVYARLAGIDRAGLMWEWLRRDPGYIAWHARASVVTRGHASGDVPDVDPIQWGLHFRRESGPHGPRRPADLACRL
ncbi:DUF6499 domain-containing protein [uncultured Sphingomonas sp.]|uniref:transcriptional regulator domain-containing protein n=1 Tax=uncultured Sphingomonas sp. TaxID=158754 RepID=UPI00345BF735